VNDQPPHRDSFLEEVQALKRGFAERFENDLDHMVAHLREIEAQMRDRIVDRSGARTNVRRNESAR
jgi:hypothetical protein